jgi:hypothetical protein
MNQLRTFPAALTALTLALVAGSADATAVAPATWTLAGDAAVVGDQLLMTTSATAATGQDDAPLPAGARNLSGHDPLQTDTVGGLEDAVGLTGQYGALDPDPVNHFIAAYEGSAVVQTFSTAAGSRLTFHWNLSTLETSRDPSVADYAFMVVDGQLIALGDILGATQPVVDGDYTSQTGWQSGSVTFAAGSHTVAFGVVDVGQYVDTSELAVSDVALGVSAVPETSTLALMAAGLGLLALKRRRRDA